MGSAESAVVAKLRGRTQALLEERPYALLDLAVTRLGRSHFIAAYVKPERPVGASDIDALREQLEATYGDEIAPMRVVVTVTEQPPFD